MMGAILWACLVISHNESSPSSAHHRSNTIDLINLSIFHICVWLICAEPGYPAEKKQESAVHASSSVSLNTNVPPTKVKLDVCKYYGFPSKERQRDEVTPFIYPLFEQEDFIIYNVDFNSI